SDWSKDLLARDPHPIVHAGKHGGLDEITLACSRFTTGRDVGAFFLAHFEVALHPIKLLLGDHRSHNSFRIERVAARNALAEGRQLIDELIVHVALHEDSRTRATDLARVEEYSHHRGRHGLFQVRIREDDVGGFTAQFERDALKITGGGFKDKLTDLGRTGESDLVDTGMLCDRATRARSEAGDDIDHALGKAGLEDQLSQAKRSQRGLLRRLEDYRVATRERRAELPRRHQQRKIPRNNLTAYSHRLAQRVVEHRRVRGIGLAVYFGAPPRI